MVLFRHAQEIRGPKDWVSGLACIKMDILVFQVGEPLWLVWSRKCTNNNGFL